MFNIEYTKRQKVLVLTLCLLGLFFLALMEADAKECDCPTPLTGAGIYDAYSKNFDVITALRAENRKLMIDREELSAMLAVTNTIIYFDYDKAVVKNEYDSDLDMVAAILKRYGFNFVLVGNTDERGTNKYNKVLGFQRSTNVAKSIVNRGANPGSVLPVSNGELNPAVPESTEAAWAKNRRVEFFAIKK